MARRNSLRMCETRKVREPRQTFAASEVIDQIIQSLREDGLSFQLLFFVSFTTILTHFSSIQEAAAKALAAAKLAAAPASIFPPPPPPPARKDAASNEQ